MRETHRYLMESPQETERLEKKTDVHLVHEQARWAGIRPGMRVADIGCGSGITSRALYDLVQPGGEVVGIDMSVERLAFARQKYSLPCLSFECQNVQEPMAQLGRFDFVWVRFFLEYHRSRAFEIVRNLAQITRPGGIMCLVDLDYNCLSHFSMPERLAAAMQGVMRKLEQEADFDPHAGIKLYSFLYDLGFEEIDAMLAPHHLIFGQLNEVDAFNWAKKVEVAGQGSGYAFSEYPGGYPEFVAEFQAFFASPRRFTYTPLIACRGRKPTPPKN